MDTGIWERAAAENLDLKKNSSTFCLQQSQDNLNKEIFSFILSFSLLRLLSAVDQSSSLKELSQSMFCQRLWHHIRFFWFRQNQVVLFITLKAERKTFIHISGNSDTPEDDYFTSPTFWGARHKTMSNKNKANQIIKQSYISMSPTTIIPIRFYCFIDNVLVSWFLQIVFGNGKEHFCFKHFFLKCWLLVCTILFLLSLPSQISISTKLLMQIHKASVSKWQILGMKCILRFGFSWRTKTELFYSISIVLFIC